MSRTLSAPTYVVDHPHAADRRPAEARGAAPTGRTAIIVAHGMGQQLQFQTLNDVADGLRAAARRAGARTSQVRARAVGVGDDRLQRLEMTVDVRDVHVYEAYWAPLTEGQVTLRDVIAFLFHAGVDGIRHSFRWFKRYLAQQYVEFAVPIRTPVYLLVALLAVLSLIVVNTVVVALPALRTPMHDPPPWVSNLLFRDVTAVLDVFVDAVLLFAATLGLSYAARSAGRAARLLTGWLSIAAFVALIAVTIGSGGSLPAILSYYIEGGSGTAATASVLDAVFSHASVERLLDGTAMLLLWLTTLALAVLVFVAVVKIVRGAIEPLFKPGYAGQYALTIVVLAAFAGVLVGAGVPVYRLGAAALAARNGVPAALWRLSLAWPLTIGASALARSFLVQYVGDVAAYIEPQELDRFSTLRERIKDRVWTAARAVYRANEGYDRILVAGHSLGSVIAYDTLNRLIREEALGTVPDVTARTKLLLTFGSPLDKIAFLFTIQGRNCEGREALAASVQPLIWDPAHRPAWVNIYSPWDIISGSLGFFDAPSNPVHAVQNRADPEASVWLGAHTQYWSGRLLFDTLYRHL